MSAYASERAAPGARYAENIYFQDGKAVTAILVGLLYLLLAVSLDAAGYVESLAVLFPVTLGAFVLGVFMSASRFDGFFALSHSMFTGLAWILFLMSRSVTKVEIAPFLSNGIPETQADAYFVLLRWLNWVDAAVNNAASADNYVFIFEMAFLVWWLTYLGVWSIFRYGYTWRAIVPAGVVLLINAYYAPESILPFLIVFLLLALLLLVRTNLSEQQLRWRDQRVHYSQDIALDFLRNGLLYSVIVLALAWIVPGLGRNVQVRTVLSPINQQWEDTQERVSQLYRGLNRQAGAAGPVFGNTLTLGGARDVTNDLVFSVRTPAGRYWRAVVFDTFTGQTWLSTASDEMSFAAEETVPAAGWEMRTPITQTIKLAAPTGNVLFGAPDIVRASVPMQATIRFVPTIAEPASDTEIRDVEISSARARRSIGVGDEYTVVSLITTVTELALRAASTEYPAEITDLFLQLPDNFSQKVAADALAVTANEDTAYGKARALEIYLRGIEYNDAIEAPPEGRDPVEYFLYDIQQGYCDYYATSMAVMLRSLGIPARMVSGYAEGFYDEESAQFLVTQRDAHSWVEVYFPGYGWIEFEPTAGESQLNRPRGTENSANPYGDDATAFGNEGLPEEAGGDEMGEMFNDPNAFGEDFELGASSSVLEDRMWWLWGILTPVVLVVGLALIWRTRFALPTDFDPHLPSILYARLQGWGTRLGMDTAPSWTPYETARRLGRAVPEGRVPIDTITETYVRYSFSGRQAPDSAANARGAWNQLQPVLWRAWARRLMRRGPSNTGSQYALVDKKV